MKKSRIHRAIIMFSMILGIALMLTACGPTYVRSGYGYNRPYNYGYNYPRPYRYAVPPPVVVMPRYSYPNRRYGGSYGHHSRGRRY